MLPVIALAVAPAADAASRSANLSVVATVVRSCVVPPPSLELTCARGAVAQVQITPLPAAGLRGSFFGVPGRPLRPFAPARSPLMGAHPPAPLVTSEGAGNDNRDPAADDTADTFLLTVNF